MTKISGTLTTKELRARVELANLQFEEDKPIDLRAVKMYVDLRRRESLIEGLKGRHHTEDLLKDTEEYNALLAVDYDEDNWDHEREAALFVEKVNLNNTSSDKLKKEGWSLLTRLEKDLGYTREQTMEKLSDVLQLYEKNYKDRGYAENPDKMINDAVEMLEKNKEKYK
jgi:hypothetical protein